MDIMTKIQFNTKNLKSSYSYSTTMNTSDTPFSDKKEKLQNMELDDLNSNISYGTMRRVELIMDENGLGSIPSNSTSLSSLLLFNSTHCPYTVSPSLFTFFLLLL